MTPKEEKALELVKRFYIATTIKDCVSLSHAKQCALICIDEQISFFERMNDCRSIINIDNQPETVVGILKHLKEVKQEITNL